MIAEWTEHALSVLTFVAVCVLIWRWVKLMAAIDDLTATVSRLETAATAAVNAIKAIPPSDGAALAALNTRVGAVADALQAAVNPPSPPPAGT